MKKRIAIICLLSISFFCCKNNKGILPLNKMKVVMWDMLLADNWYAKHMIDIRPLCTYLRYTTDIRLRWLRLLRQQTQQREEELHALRRAERTVASEQSRQAAITRFYAGGELGRLLHPQSGPVPSMQNIDPCHVTI